MMRKSILVALVCVLVAFSFAYAAPAGGTTTHGGSETGTGSSTTTQNADGGNVTYVNVSGTTITGRWAGFFGNVSGQIELQDASANTFYQWTVSNLTNAVVYVSNGTITDWTSSNIENINSSNTTHYPAFLQTTASDNYNNTFGISDTFTSASLSVANTNYTTTYQGGSSGTLRTYALRSIADANMIWAGVVQDDVNGFNSNDLDYQVLVPANTTTSYNFYLELP